MSTKTVVLKLVLLVVAIVGIALLPAWAQVPAKKVVDKAKIVLPDLVQEDQPDPQAMPVPKVYDDGRRCNGARVTYCCVRRQQCRTWWTRGPARRVVSFPVRAVRWLFCR